MAISASLVKELRERTGSGMMECKKALVKTDGDIEAAIEYMRKNGMAKADKKAGRIAAEGCITVAGNGSEAVILEVNSETDFVSKGDEFTGFAKAVAESAFASQAADVDALAEAPLADSDVTVDHRRRELIAKLGENISVRRFTRLQGERVGQYLHGSRIGVIVALEGGDDELARDIAMHIAAADPRCISPDDMPAEDIEREKRILVEQAQQSGKPIEIIEKMITGRLNKWLGEITLVGQPFVKDPDVKIGKLLSSKNAKVLSYQRFAVGEGIEKKEENFAEEVMAQVRGE